MTNRFLLVVKRSYEIRPDSHVALLVFGPEIDRKCWPIRYVASRISTKIRQNFSKSIFNELARNSFNRISTKFRRRIQALKSGRFARSIFVVKMSANRRRNRSVWFSGRYAHQVPHDSSQALVKQSLQNTQYAIQSSFHKSSQSCLTSAPR